jgi:hypothetical protein
MLKRSAGSTEKFQHWKTKLRNKDGLLRSVSGTIRAVGMVPTKKRVRVRTFKLLIQFKYSFKPCCSSTGQRIEFLIADLNSYLAWIPNSNNEVYVVSTAHRDLVECGVVIAVQQFPNDCS